MEANFKFHFKWSTFFAVLFMVCYFFLLQGMWDGYILGQLSRTIHEIVLTAAVLLPCLAAIRFFSVTTLMKLVNSGSPLDSVVREELKKANELEKANEASKQWIARMWEKHISNVYKVFFVVLAFLNGLWVCSILVGISFIVSELSKHYHLKLVEKVNA